MLLGVLLGDADGPDDGSALGALLGVLLGDADGMDVLLGSTEGVLVGAADGTSVSPSLVGAAVVGDADGAVDGSCPTRPRRAPRAPVLSPRGQAVGSARHRERRPAARRPQPGTRGALSPPSS